MKVLLVQRKVVGWQWWRFTCTSECAV